MDESSKSSPAVRILGREMLATTVLAPVVALVEPNNVNSWILMGFDAASADPAEADAPGSKELDASATDGGTKPMTSDGPGGL